MSRVLKVRELEEVENSMNWNSKKEEYKRYKNEDREIFQKILNQAISDLKKEKYENERL